MRLKLDRIIPIEEPVYDLIRDEADTPITLSEIRHRIEKKYNTYLSVFQEDGYKGFYYVPQRIDNKPSAFKSDRYYPTFNDAMKALILSLKEKDLIETKEQQ